MAKLKFLEKSPIAEIRQTILGILQSSRLYLKQNDLDRVGAQLDTVDILQSFIPSDYLESQSFVSHDEINKRLEASYVDHLINYARVKNLVDGIGEAEKLYIDTVEPVINRILDHESKIKVFKRIQSKKGIYNTILHETFNYDNNYEGTDRRLSVNKVTGSLRLNGSGKLLTTKEKSNITYEVLSEGVQVVDEGPIDNLYNRDRFKPWFVSFTARNFIKNNRYSKLDLSNYSGVAIALRIQFPSVQQLNRVTFSYFSTDVMDILGVFYSELYNQDLNSINLKKADIAFYQNREDTAKEMNIVAVRDNDTEIIQASEVIIVLGQTDFIRVDNSFAYRRLPNLDEFKTLLGNHEFDRKVELNGLKPLKNPTLLFDKDRVLSQFATVNLKEGDKNFVLGLTLFSIENIEYEPYGNFSSKDYKVNGNIVAFALDATKKTTLGIREAVEMFFININKLRLAIASTDDSGRVLDSVLLRTYNITENKYIATTNFIPEIVNGKFKDGALLYLDGNPLKAEDYFFFSRTPRGWSIIVTAPAAHESSVLTMTYYPAAVDHSNTAYDPTRIDMIKVAGKPNVDINFLTYNLNDYIFLQGTLGEIVSYKEGTEIQFTEVNDNVYAAIYKTDTKGIIPANTYTPLSEETTLFNTTDYYYIPEKNVIDMELEVYTLLKGKRLRYNSSPINKWSDIPSPPTSGLLTFTVEAPYIKNMIVLEADKVLYVLGDDNQYLLDTTGNIRAKNVVQIPVDWIQNASDIRVHFMPLFYDATLLQSNILNQNTKEVFDNIRGRQINLNSYPYIDIKILQSSKWKLSRGVFFHKDNFSVTYEPIVVKINNRKAFNVTQYIQDQEQDIFDERDITYTLTENQIIFDRDVDGLSISAEYYVLGNAFSLDIEMFKGDASKYFTTPELNDYTILMATKK
jgi:hypothetical protein